MSAPKNEGSSGHKAFNVHAAQLPLEALPSPWC